ncbi:MAG: DUF4393 domain-containing protein [Nocardia sp.]|nr:DUF4393 domain-containing protein [Nocardia sp.]
MDVRGPDDRPTGDAAEQKPEIETGFSEDAVTKAYVVAQDTSYAGPEAPEPVSGELVARAPGDLVRAERAGSGWVGPVRAGTGVARVALGAVGEATSWTLGTAFAVTSTVVRGSMAGHPPRVVLARANHRLRESVLWALGIDTAAPEAPLAASAPGLRERGAELLRRSASVREDEDREHPAFARILSELAPDEARILRLLYLDGAQAALDIRPGRSGAERIEVGLSLIAESAAVRFGDRVVTYLTNLRRLGLITVDGERLDNPARYQLLESQHDMRRLLKRGSGVKVSRRSIALTAFGVEFTRTCLPVPPLDRAQQVSGPSA